MPHSAGGGSSHGGSHHSSSSSGGFGGGHSSSSSRSSGVTISTSYFRGCYPYVRYDRVNRRYTTVYTSQTIEELNAQAERNKKIKKPVTIALGVSLIAVFLYVILSGFVIHTKVTGVPREDNKVTDNIGFFTEEGKQQIEDTLFELYDKTGVATEVVTCLNSDWMDKCDSFEIYARYLYSIRWSDEKHLLIAISNESTTLSDTDEWYFEVMVGDDTTKAIADEDTYILVDNLQSSLWRSWGDKDMTGAEVSTALLGLVSSVKGTYYSSVRFEYALASIGKIIFLLVFVAIWVFAMPTKTYEDYVPANGRTPLGTESTDKPIAVHCDYCNGTYFLGSVTQCPYCAAAAMTVEDFKNKQASI